MIGLDEIPTLPWSERASSAPFLPGGNDVQKARLIELLKHINATDSAQWITNEEVLTNAFHQIGNLGFAERAGSGYALTEMGKAWLSSEDDVQLFQVMHSRLVYFGELLAQLDGDGALVEDLLQEASSNFRLDWASRDQVRRRLTWLQVLGLAEDGPERLHVLTEKGRKALELVSLVTPADILNEMSPSGEVNLDPPPPLLASLLRKIDQSKRRMPIGYVPKDAIDALCFVVDRTQSAINKDDLSQEIAGRFGISDSSASTFVMTSRILGVHKYSGRDTLIATELGNEWRAQPTEVNLVRLLHLRHMDVGEVLPLLGSDPIAGGEIHRRLFSGLAKQPPQSRTAGVLRRLSDAGAVKGIGYARFVITPVGRALAAELPMLERDMPMENVVPGANEAALRADPVEIRAGLIRASSDITNARRFEEQAAMAFRALGVEATHIGGPGATDVLVSVTSNLTLLGRVIVDAKSAASGQLREDSVVIETLKEHAQKYEADRIVVIAPGYENAGRLPDRALKNGIVLLTAAELGDVVVDHHRIPYTPADVLDLLTVGGRDELNDRRLASEAELSLVGRILVELRAEADQDAAEPITARDIYRLLRKEDAVVERDISTALEFLAQPRIGAVVATKGGGYTLPADLGTIAIRLRTLADVINEAAGVPDDLG